MFAPPTCMLRVFSERDRCATHSAVLVLTCKLTAIACSCPQYAVLSLYCRTSANHHLVQIPIILSRTAAFPGVTYRWKIREKRTIQQCLESGSSQFGVCLVRPLVYNEP